MDIEFYCFKCGQHVVIDAAGAGQTVNCPKCGQPLTVPQVQPRPSKPTTPVYTPPLISKPMTQRRKRPTGLIVGLVVAALLILLVVIMISTGNSPSKGAYPGAYDLGYSAGVTDAVYPADSLTHSDTEKESLARKVASGVYHVEDSQVERWVASFMKGYKVGFDEFQEPGKQALVLGMRAGREMCQQGQVKPSKEVVDAMARRSGTSDTYMWKTGFERGWSDAHGL